MDEYENIETAARHRDWQGCARIMFGLLYKCTIEEQRNVAKVALYTYVEIWNAKHERTLKTFPERILTNKTVGKRPELPEFPEDLDPADAEFENALIEYYNGTFFRTGHAQRTVHFATAIRSAVTARQINAWLREHPDDYATWKAGRGIEGPTFLADEAAADEAQMAWTLVADLLKKQRAIVRRPFAGQFWSSRQMAQLYKRWEESVL
jgi:hypothetical protein